MNIFRRLTREEDAWRKVIHSEDFNMGFDEGYCRGKKDAAPKWTPVSEGLPDENEDVLVTAVFSDGQKEVGTLSLNKGKWTNGYFSYNDAVTAWMPKPKPYEEEKE